MSSSTGSSSRTSTVSGAPCLRSAEETRLSLLTLQAATPRSGGNLGLLGTLSGSATPVAIAATPAVFLLFHDVYASNPRESGFSSPAADRYKLSLEQFDRQLSGLAGARSTSLPFAVTFDDGGLSYYTQIADRIEAMKLQAHCFVPTDYLDRTGFMSRQQIQELDRRGHHIGSHSASHPARISACSAGVVLSEWTRSLAVLQDILGHEVSTASVPGGFYSRAVAEAAAAAGVKTLFTSEPVTRTHRVGSCEVIGRFTVRQSSPPDLSANLVRHESWSRWAAWTSWNVKSALKPILGPAYLHIADWLTAPKVTGH
jgi:peptidoglycan/xylan/chitin deacetylase (PgdA/CDA1 family)